MENSEFFDKNNKLPPLEKCKYYALFKLMFCSLKIPLLFLEPHQTFFIDYFALKENKEKSKFLGKNKFWDVFKWIFL